MLSPMTWSDVALRLVLTALASALFGFNRGERGHAAGLRTTMLVGLAAGVAMIEANGLLHTVGKASDSFVSIDPMRLPLGILSGIGFIGAGAIVRRGERIAGVTTAATLWFVTVVGLCFGAGFLLLGLAATSLGMGVLVGMKLLDRRMSQERQATLKLCWRGEALSEAEVRETLAREGFRVRALCLRRSGEQRRLSLRLRWRAREEDVSVPEPVRALGMRAQVTAFEWKT